VLVVDTIRVQFATWASNPVANARTGVRAAPRAQHGLRRSASKNAQKGETHASNG
jgi:hypothetical protein